nr:progonadoliberin-2 [Zootoca vivipara]
MAYQRSILLSLCIMLTISMHLSSAQHWSHGWYPGGKREIDLPQSPEVSEDIKLCDGEDCTHLKIPRDKIVKTLLADMLARQLQKKK